MALIQQGVNNEAENFGIKIVDVRIKRADLPQIVMQSLEECRPKEKEKLKSLEQKVLKWQLLLHQLQIKKLRNFS